MSQKWGIFLCYGLLYGPLFIRTIFLFFLPAVLPCHAYCEMNRFNSLYRKHNP